MPDVTLVGPYPAAGREVRTGVAGYTQELSHALAAAGAEVTVLAPHDGAGRQSDQDGPVRIERRFPRNAAGLARMAPAAAATGAPVVHLQHEAFLYGGPASAGAFVFCMARLRAARRGPVVTMHQVVRPAAIDRRFTQLHQVNVPPALARVGMATLQASVASLASRTIVHEAAFGEVIPGSVTIPLAAGSKLPMATVADGQRLRDAHGIGREAFVVLCFGFVAPYKGLESALAAAEIAGPPVRLVVAGAEHPRLASRRYLEGLIERYRNVATFTGYVPDSDVSGWFRAADVALAPYPQAFSSSGVVALAAHHSTPILLSPSMAATCNTPDLAVPLDPEQIAGRLQQLARDPAATADLARRSSVLQAGRSWPDVASRHLCVYQEVIDAQRAARPRHPERPRG